MRKLLIALVGLVSISGLVFGLSAASAQDRPADGTDETATDVTTTDGVKAMIVPHGITRSNVEVKDRPLIIEGEVQGSVHAVNSRVTLMPGAKVEGNLTVEGGTLSAGTAMARIVATGPAAITRSPARDKRGNWLGGQFCLLLLGLIGGIVVLLAGPNAMSNVTETVSARPGRSLLTGILTSAVICAALAVSGMIMGTKSFFSLLWMPVLICVALASLFLLVFGWLAGMRRVGDILARKSGQMGAGSFYGRMTLGLTTFFVANALLGGINPVLGAIGVMVEFGVALMGIGAIVQTGFGRDEEWLGRTLGHGIG